MFDIGFPELVIISIVALVVLGPERLPEALRTLGLWFGRARRSFTAVKSEIEREIGMDDVRRQLHNESIMDEMQRLEADVQKIGQQAKSVTESAAAVAEDEAQAIQDAVLEDAVIEDTAIDTPELEQPHPPQSNSESIQTK